MINFTKNLALDVDRLNIIICRLRVPEGGGQTAPSAPLLPLQEQVQHVRTISSS